MKHVNVDHSINFVGDKNSKLICYQACARITIVQQTCMFQNIKRNDERNIVIYLISKFIT